MRQHIQIGLIEVIFIIRHFLFKSTLKYAPCQILGNKKKKVAVLSKLREDIIYDKMHLLVKFSYPGSLQCLMCTEKQLTCFMGNQFVADIILILKIKIKSTLGNPGLIYNI